MFTLIVAAALIFSNVSLFYVLVNLLKPGQRRFVALDSCHTKKPKLPKLDRPHIWVRARSSLARPGARAASLRALRKLKGCLCTPVKEETLPLFQIHCTDFKRGVDAITKDRSQGERKRSMSKMHSWPPMQQGIERPMSDLQPVFSVPALPKVLCPVPEEDPLTRPAEEPAKAGYTRYALAEPGDMESRRQAEELRRVLRAMYKTHFQMETTYSCASSRSSSLGISMTPTADELKAELLAHGMKPLQPGTLPGKPGKRGQAGASDVEATLLFSPAAERPQRSPECAREQATQAFPQATSCPPEFWGEEKCQELCAQRPAKSMDFLLDTLLDMSVAALVSPSSSMQSSQLLLPVSMRSAFEQANLYGAHNGSGRTMPSMEMV